jgi:hypothetical protein
MEAAVRDFESLRCVRYVNYRLALKINSLQKHTLLLRVHHKFVYEALKSPALVTSDGRLLLSQVNDLLTAIYREVRRTSKSETERQIDDAKGVCMNFILMIFDSSLSGRQLCFYQVGVLLLLLSAGRPSEKAQSLFNLLSKESKVTKEELKYLFGALDLSLAALHESLTTLITSADTLGVSNVIDNFWTTALPLRSREWIGSAEFVQSFTSSEFLKWVTLAQRLDAMEQCEHQVQCSCCKSKPISGLLYVCLRCSKVLICQMCHLTGREFDDHVVTHPVREYQSSPVLERSWHRKLLCISSNVHDGRPMVDKVQPCTLSSKTQSVHDLDTPGRTPDSSPLLTNVGKSRSSPLLTGGIPAPHQVQAGLGRVLSATTSATSVDNDGEKNRRFWELIEHKREMETALRQYKQLESEVKEEKNMKAQVDHLMHVRQHLANQLENLIDKVSLVV